MTPEQRVVAPPKIKIGAKPAKAGAGAAPAPGTGKRGRRRWLLLGALVAALAVVAAAIFFWPSGADGAETPAPPEPGELVAVEPISINLAGSNYLRLGFSMQLTAEAEEEIYTAPAVDLAIALFSGRPVAELNDPATREALKAELLSQLRTTYEGEVMDVYLTDFVTQ